MMIFKNYFDTEETYTNQSLDEGHLIRVRNICIA